MDRDNSEKRKVNPRETANVLSLVTFFYTLKLYLKGYRKGLEFSDIYAVPSNAHTRQLSENLQRKWFKEKDCKHPPSICRVLWKCYGKTVLLIGIIQFATTIVMTTLSPKALSKLISYFAPNQTNLTKQDAIFYACLVVVLNLVNTFVRHNFFILLALHAMKAKAALAGLLYRKSLNLTSESLSHVTSGKIVTIITKDLDELEVVLMSGNSIWIALIQTVVVCYLIYQKIGIASVSGIAFFIVVLPLQIYIGKLTYNYKLKCSKKTDERLDLIREVLIASKIIKMYTWEKFFEEKIHTARKEEIKELHKVFYTDVLITVIGGICSKSAFFLFVMTYVWTGHNASAETVYYILSCFGDLESSLSDDIPSGLAKVAQLFATTKRVESILKAAEISPKTQPVETKKAKIIFKNVDVKLQNTIILKDVSLTISKGLNVIIGNTGSGKTTFLKAILQECDVIGNFLVSGKISYASQEPWLFPSTIKNNILFGEQYDETRYQEVLIVCSLNYDLQLLPEGDNTVIGESGANVSKGQQVRINLARAVYRNSDIYLLDDCLASLDANVSDDIFRECICHFLRNKIRIFVTNNTEYVKNADKIIVVESRSVLLKDRKESISKFEPDGSYHKDKTGVVKSKKTENRKHIYHEDKRSGTVPLRDYYKYIQLGGGFLIFGVIVFVFIITQATSSYSEKLLSTWVTLEENLTSYKQLNNTDLGNYTILENERNRTFTLSTILAGTSILFLLVKSFSFFRFMQMASNNLHKKMVYSVINSTTKFFDSHFIGNVINRFTKDYVTVDYTLPFVGMRCITRLFSAFGGIVLLTTISYIFLVESVLLLLAVCAVKQFCQPAGRNLERLHVIARSPLTGHLNSTLEGLTTIRASNAQEVVISEFDRHQNVFTAAYFMVVTNFISMGIFLKYVCAVFTVLVIFQFLITDIGSSIGDVGLAITQSFIITNILTSGIINVADIENFMVSLERILEFTRLEEEPKDGKILLGWPKLGAISFHNVCLNYSNSTTLENVNFLLNPKEKLGILGRTGAGKSSIISSLFRLYQTSGVITIDGININEVSLNWLRSNLSVIPQNPYLFPGTIRENLDPLKQYKDDQIWTILKELRLDNLINSLDLKIDKGSSFSAGQKQLLCFARVILRKNKIVILDEVAANVDQEVEELIEDAVQKHFSNCTMLIVAHKTLSVLNCNKIMVLDRGKVSKFEEPKKVSQNTICTINDT